MEPCKMLDCWFNNNGYCSSVSDLYDPDEGEDCLDYLPD